MSPDAARSRTLGKGRRRGIRVLVVLGSVLAFLAIFSVWIERQVLNTDDWVATSAELIEDETVRTAIADYLVDELYANVDMEAELKDILPEEIKGLAGPAAGGLRQGAGQATERILRSNTAQSLWETANRAAHRELVLVLEGGDERVSTEGGVVTLDLGAMLRDLGRQIGLSTSLTSRIPADAGRIEILRSDELKTAQQVAQAIKGLALLLCLLALASFAGAVYLSRDQRWVALLMTSIGLISAAFAVLIVRRIAGGLLVNQLVEDPGVRPAADAAWSIGTSLLAAIAVSVIIFGCFLALASWLAAPAPSSRYARRFLAPGLRDQVPYFYGGLVALAGLYLLISPSHNLRSLFTILVIVALGALGIRELRRMTMAEYPDVPAWTGLSKLRIATGNAWQRLAGRGKSMAAGRPPREGTAGPPTAPPPSPNPHLPPVAPGLAAPAEESEATAEPAQSSAPAPAPGSAPRSAQDPDDIDTRLARLERLAALHERGILSDEELAAEKARLLGKGRDLP